MHYRSAIPVLVGCLFATNVLAADLMQTYMEALANDPQYASARASLMAGQEKSTQGLAKLLPNLSASGGYGRNWFEGLNYNENKYTIALTQPIFNWANYQNYETSKLQVSISEAQFAQAQQDLMMRVSQAYFDILAAEDVVTFAKAQKAAVAQQLELAKRSFQVGTTTITDTHEAQARYNLAEADEISALNDLEVKRTALEQIIGHPPGELDPLKKGVKLSAPEPNVMTSWVSSAENQNYQVVQYRLSREVAKRNIKATQAGHMPTVDSGRFIQPYQPRSVHDRHQWRNPDLQHAKSGRRAMEHPAFFRFRSHQQGKGSGLSGRQGPKRSGSVTPQCRPAGTPILSRSEQRPFAGQGTWKLPKSPACHPLKPTSSVMKSVSVSISMC